jgi:hypothetical protein
MRQGEGQGLRGYIGRVFRTWAEWPNKLCREPMFGPREFFLITSNVFHYLNIANHLKLKRCQIQSFIIFLRYTTFIL